VSLTPESVVREAAFFVAIDVEAGSPDARVRMASAIEPAWLRELFPAALAMRREILFDPERERVVERTRECYHDLVLAEAVRLDVDPLAAGEVLATAARTDPAHAAGVGDAERSLLARLAFLARWMPELDLPGDPEQLLADTVVSLCAGRRSFAELRALDVAGAIAGHLGPAQRGALAREAPEYYVLPSGRRTPVRYERDRPPAIAARIQEVFGLSATPRLAAGRVALVVELLAPNQRPVQITDDLASFWRTTYAEVRGQLRGRYPRHPWPEDPLAAVPTSRVGRRR
jgi:ATP-dependent helicase HrpB